jgi:hypothetical protein
VNPVVIKSLFSAAVVVWSVGVIIPGRWGMRCFGAAFVLFVVMCLYGIWA